MLRKYKNIFWINFAILMLSCEHNVTDPDTGSANGKIAFYEGQQSTSQMNVFLSTVQLTYMPIQSLYLMYRGGLIVADSDVNAQNEYQLSGVPPGKYYLNIGYVVETDQGNFDKIPPIMSYHGTEPKILIEKTNHTSIQTVVLFPGGTNQVLWRRSDSPNLTQGFNFTTGEHAIFEDSDIWFDGENDLVITRGNNIVELPNIPEGLSHYCCAPDTGYKSQVFTPLVNEDDPNYVSQFVIKTQNSTFVKVRIFTRGLGGSSNGIALVQELTFRWFHQPNGSKRFAY